MTQARKRIVRGSLVVLALGFLASACGSPETPADTEILAANVEDDLPQDTRRWLVGVLRQDPVRVSFPDGEGTVEVEVISARNATETGGQRSVDTTSEPSYLRSIHVRVVDAAGYELSAALLGSPTNEGTTEAPRETRIVQITRQKSGLTGTSMAQMSIRVRPTGAERI